IGWQPDYQAEGKAYAQYINTHNADAKIAIIYQNDDYGKDYLTGFKAALKNKAQIVGEEGYEVTSATVASQVAKLKGTKADTFVTTLYKAGKNPTRASIMRAAIHLNESNPFVLPKVKVKTTPSRRFPICKMQLYRYGAGHYSSISGLLAGC